MDWRELVNHEVVKAHGTGNDFVVFTDEYGEVPLTADTVAAVSDRHMGLGADGLIRVVRASELPEGRKLLEQDPSVECSWTTATRTVPLLRCAATACACSWTTWFGKGSWSFRRVRSCASVPARVCVPWPAPKAATPWTWARGASLPVRTPARRLGRVVTTDGLNVPRPGLSISMGNPHTVVALSEEDKLDQLDLRRAPSVSPEPKDGTNVEFVVPVDHDDTEVGRIHMRVFERGVGETYSCGTGACAAAAATRFWGGADAPDRWLVEVPGGVLSVTFVPATDGTEHVVLAGPTRVVARAILV